MVLLTASAGALAYPEGAPWGAANPDARESCASCHYDYEPVHDSSALGIEGLPAVVAPGERYDLVIRIAGVDAAIAGFQLLATPEGEVGSFDSADDAIESIGPASRSIAPADGVDGLSWSVTWRAPKAGCSPIRFYLAAAAANDDQSPFGDTIHYRQFIVERPNVDDK